MDDYTIEYVDPRKIVNEYFSRPILPRDLAVVREGFLQNGYTDAHLISCRPAKAPEIESFLRRKQKYSQQRAAKVTKGIMAKCESGGYRFCYDGHIRKDVSIELIDKGLLPQNFKSKSSLHHGMSTEEEIAFSLAKNAAQSYCVPLTFLVTLIRCHDYDREINASRASRKQKPLSAKEVARKMVVTTARNMLEEKLVGKQAETKRQILGVCRRLPVTSTEHLRNFLLSDIDGDQVALTLGNMRAIPRNASDEEVLCLIKRLVAHYRANPSPKALNSKRVPEQLVQVRRAQGEISKFLKLCEYEQLPEELSTISERMLCTQLLDCQLGEHVLKDELFEPLAVACRNSVPNGTNHLEIAVKRLEEKETEQGESRDADQAEKGNSETKSTDVNVSASGVNESSGNRTSASENGAGEGPLDASDNHTCKTGQSNAHGEPGSTRQIDQEDDFATNPDDSCSNKTGDQSVDNCNQTNGVGISAENDGGNPEDVLPVGWRVLNVSPQEFAHGHVDWKLVEGKCDMVLTQVPDSENNDTWLKQLVRHCGLAMKLTGVCHMFCSFLQFAKIYNAVCEEGMQMMKHPMIYLQDPGTIKKRTLNQYPQESGMIAAVFWRSPDIKQKHHYSTRKKYQNSSVPPWVNCVTNFLPAPSPLVSSEGSTFKVLDVHKELYAYVLEQWCKPAGLCYNPRSGAMSSALACVDLGIQYVAVEEDKGLFDAALKRLIVTLNEQSRKRQKTEVHHSRCTRSTLTQKACGIGAELCKFPGHIATYKCQGCEKMMHDLCDWAKLVKKIEIGNREMVSVCSEACFAHTSV